jgi:hypothetical protein
MIDISMKHCADYVAKGKVKVMNARLLFEAKVSPFWTVF